MVFAPLHYLASLEQKPHALDQEPKVLMEANGRNDIDQVSVKRISEVARTAHTLPRFGILRDVG